MRANISTVQQNRVKVMNTVCLVMIGISYYILQKYCMSFVKILKILSLSSNYSISFYFCSQPQKDGDLSISVIAELFFFFSPFLYLRETEKMNCIKGTSLLSPIVVVLETCLHVRANWELLRNTQAWMHFQTLLQQWSLGKSVGNGRPGNSRSTDSSLVPCRCYIYNYVH